MIISEVLTLSQQSLDDLSLLSTIHTFDAKIDKFKNSIFYHSLNNLQKSNYNVIFCIPSNLLCQSTELTDIIIHDNINNVGVSYLYDKHTDAFYFDGLDDVLRGMIKMYEFIFQSCIENGYYQNLLKKEHKMINQYNMMVDIIRWFDNEYTSIDNLTSLWTKKMKL